MKSTDLCSISFLIKLAAFLAFSYCVVDNVMMIKAGLWRPESTASARCTWLPRAGVSDAFYKERDVQTQCRFIIKHIDNFGQFLDSTSYLS